MTRAFGMAVGTLGQWMNRSLATIGKVYASLIELRLERSRKHAVRHLESLSDHVLKDIGIKRHMIEFAVKHGRGEARATGAGVTHRREIVISNWS